MKNLKRISTSIVVALLIILNLSTSSFVSASNYWESEDNNSFSSADSINLGYTYKGITDDYNKYDYYKFELPKNGYVDIKFKQNSNVKYRYDLIGQDQDTNYGSWTTSFSSATSTNRLGLPAGTYYLRVKKYSSSYENTEYNFSVNFTSSSYWESEYNNSFNTADNIKLGYTYKGITDSYCYYDYYKFKLPRNGYFYIRFNQNSKVKYNYDLIGEDQNTNYGRWTTSFSSKSSSKKVYLKAGTYYLRVKKYSSSYENTEYNFSIGQYISTFTVNTVKVTSSTITGKGLSGATVSAYVGSKKIGSSTVNSSGNYSIKIPKQSPGKKITVKISKSGYFSKEISTIVKK